MTKENFTSINCILDMSGSMEGLTVETINSFNKFLKEQKEFPGEAIFSLCTFNSEYNLIHDCVNIKDVKELDNVTYFPSGGTALLDAMGRTISAVGHKLSQMQEEERPSKVLFLIITDGHENASREYERAKIKEMVEHQQSKYSWTFVFLGANIDSIAAGSSIGISAINTSNYVGNSIGLRDMYATVSSSATQYRSNLTIDPTKSFFEPVVPTNTNIKGTDSK